jgi:hypothetical protein
MKPWVQTPVPPKKKKKKKIMIINHASEMNWDPQAPKCRESWLKFIRPLGQLFLWSFWTSACDHKKSPNFKVTAPFFCRAGGRTQGNGHTRQCSTTELQLWSTVKHLEGKKNEKCLGLIEWLRQKECLPGEPEALSSNPRTVKINK